MEIKQDLTSVNFTSNGMKQVRGIVLHSMWGTQAGSISWFKNPQAQASAHYCVGKDGQIVQCVLDKDMAWHAGIFDEPVPDWVRPNPNYYCIGIELEDNRDSNWAYPQAQREATAWLLDMLMKKYGIAKDHVLLHKNLNPSRRSDPVGQFSFDWAFTQLNQTPTDTDVDRGVKNLIAYRGQRVQGTEGNFEGFANAIIGSDKDAPNKEKVIKELTDAIGKTKTELASEILSANKKIEELNASWQTKLDLVNAKLEHNADYVLNVSDKNVLFKAWINKLFGVSKTKEQLDQEFGLKGGGE